MYKKIFSTDLSNFFEDVDLQFCPDDPFVSPPLGNENKTKWYKFKHVQFKCTFTENVVNSLMSSNINWVHDSYTNLGENENAKTLIQKALEFKKENGTQPKRLSWSHIFDRYGKVLEKIEYHHLSGVTKNIFYQV